VHTKANEPAAPTVIRKNMQVLRGGRPVAWALLPVYPHGSTKGAPMNETMRVTVEKSGVDPILPPDTY